MRVNQLQFVLERGQAGSPKEGRLRSEPQPSSLIPPTTQQGIRSVCERGQGEETAKPAEQQTEPGRIGEENDRPEQSSEWGMARAMPA